MKTGGSGLQDVNLDIQNIPTRTLKTFTKALATNGHTKLSLTFPVAMILQSLLFRYAESKQDDEKPKHRIKFYNQNWNPGLRSPERS